MRGSVTQDVKDNKEGRKIMDTTTDVEIEKLKEKNVELAKNVQYWKMTAAQRESEKLTLIKENNELRLKLSRISNTGEALARNLDTGLQATSEKALALLVRASEEIARTMELAKAYKRDRQQLDEVSPRWTMLSGTPSSEKKDKINRVPPLMMGGQSIQPVVALSRTGLDSIVRRTPAPNSSQNTNVTVRAVPIHLLQNVYIPLTRVDAENPAQNMDTDGQTNDANDSTEDLELDDSEERMAEDSLRMLESQEIEPSPRLSSVREEPEDEEETPTRSITDNPLEGPSWLLDVPPDNQPNTSKSRNLEPDSTTEVEEGTSKTPGSVKKRRITDRLPAGRVSREFSPTVRRRKRSGSPPASPILPSHYSPRARARRHSPKGRVLKVVLSKMQLECPERRVASEAPSPNGATVPGVIVSDDLAGRLGGGAGDTDLPNVTVKKERTTRENAAYGDDDHRSSRACSSDSDSGAEGAGRSRRHRKPVTYKEKPLNRKLRR